MNFDFNSLALVRDWYARHEENPKGAFLINPNQASSLNEQRHAISWTVNFFDRMPRQKIFLKKIFSYAVDIDRGSKSEQINLINAGPMPSAIVETKNGFHVYWNVHDAEPCAEKYRVFLIDRFLDRYNGDINAMDACRILRVPNYFHQKDAKNPFKIKLAFESNAVYSQKILAKLLPVSEHRRKIRENAEHMKSDAPEIHEGGGDTYSIFTMDQREALKRISGDELIGGLRISFNPESGGRYRIYFNGERKNKWIDANGKIGSQNNYGPTIWQFLCAVGVSRANSITLLKKHFPEHFSNV